MSLFDDNPLEPPESCLPAGSSADQSSPSPSTSPLASDPVPSYVELGPAYPPAPSLPEDLRISWSWTHLVVFLVFGFASLLIVQIGAVLLLSANKHLTQKQLQQMIESKPQFLVGTNVLWYALLFLFLYVTLAVLRGLPFWRSLGWKRLSAERASRARRQVSRRE